MGILNHAFIIAFIYTEAKGHISWKLQTKPAVFGKDIQLACHLTSAHCCTGLTRKWVKGWTYDVVILNEACSNITKYKEYLNSTARTSILTIKDFNENDVNIPYECTYGFDTFRTVLNVTSFEYHPVEQFPYNITIKQGYVEANITMMKVFPTPKCYAMDRVNNMKQYVNVSNERNGLFYTSNIYLLLDIKQSSQKAIVVICTVGHTSFTVVNNTLPYFLAITATNKYTLEICVAIVCIVIVTAIVIISLLIYLKCWTHLKCLTWSRRSERTQNVQQCQSAHNNDQPRVSQSTSLLAEKEL